MVLIVVITSALLASQHAQASHLVDNHCVSPVSGENLNLLVGTTKQIITPFCNQVDAGEQWTAAGPAWFINTDFDLVPAGFVPAGATPLEDFVAKFAAIKYLIDPGTLQERTFIYLTSNALWIGTNAAGFQSIWPGTLSKLPPLRIGEHFVPMYWGENGITMSDDKGNEYAVVPYFEGGQSGRVNIQVECASPNGLSGKIRNFTSWYFSLEWHSWGTSVCE
jgi:hypothetical protein